MSQTEDCSPEALFPGYSEKLLQRSRVFGTVLCLVRTKTVKQVRGAFLRGFKKKRPDQHVHSESAWVWHLGGSLTIEGVTSMGVPGRGAFNFYF